MKRFLISLGAMAVAALSLTNCTKEIENPIPEVEKVPYTIYANSADTKTVNDDLSTKWAEGDALNVFYAEKGTSNYSPNVKFTLVNAETGEFKTENLSGTPAVSNDWYALYPYKEAVDSPNSPKNSGAYIIVGLRNGATQNGNTDMGHIAGDDYPMWGLAEGVSNTTVPDIKMRHLSSLLKVKVKNSTDEPLVVTDMIVTAEQNITGTYFINFNSDTPEFTPSGDNYVSKKAILRVESGTPILKTDEAAEFYIAVKPFVAAAGETITLTVNGLEKPITLSNSVTFSPGKIKILNFDYNQVVAEPEPFDLADGKYWMIADGKVARPLSATTSKAYGYLGTEDAVEGKSTAANAFTFTKISDGKYTIVDSDGKYLYQQGTYNSFNVSTTLGDNDGYYWSIAKKGEDYVIKNLLVEKYIQYDSSYDNYGSYDIEKGSLPVLVKMDETEPEPEPVTPLAVPAVVDLTTIDIDAAPKYITTTAKEKYSGDKGWKVDTDKGYVQFFVDSSVQTVKVVVKGYSTKDNSSLELMGSADGETFTSLGSNIVLTTDTTFEYPVSDESYRYFKFVYNRLDGNVSVKKVEFEKPDSREQLGTPVVQAAVVEGTPNSVKLTWEAVTNATSYQVFHNELSEPIVTDQLTYTFTGLSYGTEYTFSVVAKGDEATYRPSEAGTATVTTETEPGTDVPGESGFVLVKDAAELEVGGKVVIVAKDSDVAMSNVQNGNNRGQTAVKKNGDNIELTSDVQEFTLEAGTTDGTFAFNTGSGYLHAASSSSNYLRTEKTLSDNSSWKIEIAAEGVATITAQGTNTRNVMQYNKSSELFACYASASQKAVSIYYKKDSRTQIEPVTNLKAELAEGVNNTVVLTWTASANANQYVVTYGEESKTVDECSATIEGLEYDKEYTFSVVANNTDEAAYKPSTAATVSKTTGTAPALVWADGATFTAKILDETKQKEVTLTWTEVENAESYAITYGSKTITVNAPANTAKVECEKYGTEYTFSIVAENPAFKPTEAKTATVTTLAAPIIKATVAEFLAAEVGTDVWYELTGTISNIVNTKFGNFDLIDANGDKVYVYGLTKTKVDKNDQSFASLGLEEGYSLTLRGTRAEHDNSPQVGGPAYYVSHVVAPVLKVGVTELSFAAAGESETVTVEVLNTEETLNVTCDNDHFSVTNSANVYTVTAAENTDTAPITGTLTISVAGLTKTVALTQAGKPAEGGTDPAQPKYVKVTTAPTDWSGTYLIVYEAGNKIFDGSLETLDAVSNYKDITISENVIEATDAVNKCLFTIEAKDSGYSIKSAGGIYIGKTADSNGFNESASTVYVNTITLDEKSNVSIVGSGNAVLRYNKTSGQDRFRYFKSTTYTNQQPIALYKLQDN